MTDAYRGTVRQTISGTSTPSAHSHAPISLGRSKIAQEQDSPRDQAAVRRVCLKSGSLLKAF